MQKSKVLITLLIAFFLCGGAGCGATKKPVKVQGIVTLDGRPVDGATVSFMPLEEGGRNATGLTGSDGVFNLTTDNTGDGAVPGSYKVVISKTPPIEETRAVSVSDPKSMQKAYGAFLKQQQKQTGPPKSSSLLPAVYGDADKTPLRQKVPAEGRAEFALRSSGGS
jgi:hypothetical protein